MARCQRFLGGVRTPTQTAAYLETSLRHSAECIVSACGRSRTYDGTFVGRAGLRHVELTVSELEVAYTFVRRAWGQGLATEIAKALVEVWERRCPEPSLVGIVMKGNLSSERVLTEDQASPMSATPSFTMRIAGSSDKIR